MAGPSIVVRVLGDLKGLASAADSAGGRVAGAAGKMRVAFSGALAAVNKTGALGPLGDALNGVDTALQQISEHGKGVGQIGMAVGGTVAGIGVGLAALGAHEKQSQQQLSQAIQNTGQSYDDYAGRIDNAIKHEEKYGNTAGKTEDALRVLTQATHDPAKALQYLSTATDLAAAKHEGLTEAATQLARMYGGNTRLLKEYGIQTQKGATSVAAHEQNVAKLAAVLHGQADAAANTFTGRMHALTATITDQVATFGQKYGPALTAAGAGMSLLSGAVTAGQGILQAFTGAQETATAATEAMAGAEDAAAVSEGLALGPILLIVAGIAALVAAAYLLVTHWKQVWTAIKAAVLDVWDWIRKNWPLLLAILLGPIATAVYLIARYWDQIKAAAAAAVDWIKGVWNGLVSFFGSIPSRLAGAVGDVFGFMRDAAYAALGAVESIWGGLWSWFAGLPSRIASAASGMWHGITDAFRAALNGLIDIWDRFHIDVGGWHIHTPFGDIGVPKFTVGMPPIPHLAAGGLMTRDGLVYAHAGEVISPAPAAARGVTIEHAHFAEALDVELFMRRAAWVMRTEAV